VPDAVTLPTLAFPLNDGRHLRLDSIVVERGERLVLFGPNGAGKSTALRCYAGLVAGVRGVDGAGYLPQRPYMFRGSARHNLHLGLTEANVARAGDIAGRLGLAGKLADPAGLLSGGERARLGIARVLAHHAPLVLLDEPLAALDARDRSSVESVIVDELGDSAAVIVTHDRDVAAAVAERMAVMIDGTIRQIGSIGSIFAAPLDDEVAEVVGIGNVIRGTIAEVASPLVRVDLGGEGGSRLDMWTLGEEQPGTPVVVMFGAEAVTVFSGDGPRGSARNHWRGAIESIRQAGRLVELVVDVGLPVVALITPGSLEALDLEPGRSVALSVKATAAQAVAVPLR
jgi:molybdate transport system ATP-binding protein